MIVVTKLNNQQMVVNAEMIEEKSAENYLHDVDAIVVPVQILKYGKKSPR